MYPQFFLSALAYFLGFYLIRAHELDYHPSWRFLPTDDCGYGAPADRIIGGKEASLGQFPWIARIGYKIKRNRPKLFYLCAGSIINQWYIITAVHCATGVLRDTISSVRVGENYIKEAEDCEFNICAPPVQDILIAEVIKYEDYVGTLAVSYGDIGLIRLTRPIIFHDFASPICLPSGPIMDNLDKYLMPGNSSIEVAGWGLTSSLSGHIPNKLMFVRMPVVSLDVCRANFTPNKIDDSQICVGIGDGRDSCVGDSGGPLMNPISLDNEPPRNYLLGIVSYGMKWCGVSAAVYTNVSYYMKWILDHIEQNK